MAGCGPRYAGVQRHRRSVAGDRRGGFRAALRRDERCARGGDRARRTATSTSMSYDGGAIDLGEAPPRRWRWRSIPFRAARSGGGAEGGGVISEDEAGPLGALAGLEGPAGTRTGSVVQASIGLVSEVARTNEMRQLRRSPAATSPQPSPSNASPRRWRWILCLRTAFARIVGAVGHSSSTSSSSPGLCPDDQQRVRAVGQFAHQIEQRRRRGEIERAGPRSASSRLP